MHSGGVIGGLKAAQSLLLFFKFYLDGRCEDVLYDCVCQNIQSPTVSPLGLLAYLTLRMSTSPAVPSWSLWNCSPGQPDLSWGWRWEVVKGLG